METPSFSQTKTKVVLETRQRPLQQFSRLTLYLWCQHPICVRIPTTTLGIPLPADGLSALKDGPRCWAPASTR